MNCSCEILRSNAHWLVRLSLAGTFIYHGVGKFPMAEMMASMLSMPLFLVYFVGVAEVLAGVLLLWGGLGKDAMHQMSTKIAAAIIAVTMVGAIVMVHWENGWDFMAGRGPGTNGMGGMEFQALILAISLKMFFAEDSCCQ